MLELAFGRMGDRGLGEAAEDAGESCDQALREANKDKMAIVRANQNWATLAAAGGTEMDPRLLAAIGVRETGFQNISQQGGGGGRGVFQITGNNVTDAQAFNISWAAAWTARTLNQNMTFIQRSLPNVTSKLDTLRVTAISHNLNIYRTARTNWNANQFDQATTGHNYGSNVLGLMMCFK